MPFQYPARAHTRRHGPRGYTDYDSYRPWLRDEFSFACVYCRKRERWSLLKGEYHIDHFQPQVLQPGLETHYENLLYACVRCNSTKRAQEVPDPAKHLTAQYVRLLPDGILEGLSFEATALLEKLDLNSPQAIEWRMCWLRIVHLAREYDHELYVRLMGFPDDLPDLASLRPPEGNARPDGIRVSYRARRERGELPDTY